RRGWSEGSWRRWTWIYTSDDQEALYETFPRAVGPVRSRRLSLLPVALLPRRDQGADRRGARALRAAPPGERAREDRRRGANELRRAHVQLPVRQARAAS